METEDEVLDGTIISVLVQNFMCHEHFKVEFKKRVTFIVGRNGSGKSAIITALVVGLGGKASETNRGKNFQSFVKKGANSATIEIKIKNSGPGAYKPEEYGEIITIVKTINASGASSYKTRSISGQLVPTNAKIVNAIVLNLNIQVNNPISVLNQDDAKDFSVRKDPTKLYSLFMRATNLDVTEENYEKARIICKSALVSCEKKNKFCIDLKNDYIKWNKMYEQMQSRKDIEKQLKLLKVEVGWSEIAEAEREVATIREQCLKQRAKCQSIEASLQAVLQTLNGAATQALEQQLAEFSRTKAEMEQQLRPLQRVAQDACHALGEIEADISRYVEVLNREKRRVCDYEHTLAIESGGAEASRAELERCVERARLAAKEARARYDTLANDAEQARNHTARLDSDDERPHVARARLSAQLEQNQQKLHELESRGSGTLAVYGASMVELCRRVCAADEQGHFSATPRGPVGRYIKVKDKRWNGVLEYIIGGLLWSFCVNTPEDSRKLFRIIDQVWCGGKKPSVTCSKFLARRHDVRTTSVLAPPYASALDTVQVDDPVVANFLIDHLAIERVLLVPSHDDAVRLADTVERVPRNCNKIVTLDCSEYHPAPMYRSYGGRAHAARLLHLDTDEFKRQLRMEIEELQTNLQKHDADMQALEAEKHRVLQRESSVLQELKAMGTALLKRQAEEARAVAALEKLQAPQQDVLQDELDALKQRVQQLNEKMSQLMDTKKKYKRELAEYEVKMRALKVQVDLANAACRRLREEIGQEEMKMERGAAEHRSLDVRLEDERKRLERVKEILSSKEEAVAARIQVAKGTRIDKPRDKAVIESLVARYKKAMNSLMQITVSREEVESKRAEAERSYLRIQGQLDKLQEYIGRIEKTAADHLKYCFKLKNNIGRLIGIHFMATLITRGYNGEIVVDHMKDTLELRVSGRDGSRSASSAASLSGGERSYTTVAFITSLWECVELPFYFMDEFDVFMDDMNRKIAVTLLLDLAAKLSGRQFVFLTPNAVNLVDHEKIKDPNARVSVDVISLAPPQRT